MPALLPDTAESTTRRAGPRAAVLAALLCFSFTACRAPQPAPQTPARAAPETSPHAESQTRPPAQSPSQTPPTTQPRAEHPSSEPSSLKPFPGITVILSQPAVEIESTCCVDSGHVGWLEQVACSPGTREYEALVVIEARPSNIHAALLLAGFEPGAPGRWSYDGGTPAFTPPTGARLDVFARYNNPDGENVEEPIRTWIADHEGRCLFPRDPWIFGGSAFAPNPEYMGPGEHYIADVTGSIIGIVTFGDEILGFSRVWADHADVQPPAWDVATDRVPPPGTPVTLVIRPFRP